VTSLLEVIKRR